MRFTCPLPSNRANAVGGWQRKHYGRRRYWDTLDQLRLVRQIPASGTTRERAAVAIELVMFNAMDPDNLTARVKDLLDWLVSRRYLAGDTAKHVQLTVTQRMDRHKGAQHAVVEIGPWA